MKYKYEEGEGEMCCWHTSFLAILVLAFVGFFFFGLKHRFGIL